mgnify:CR=1 FL=1
MKEVSFRNDVLPLKNVLFRLALRITTNREEAEDVVQETLMRVWDKRAEWDAIDSMEAFALSVCRNLSIDFTKRKGGLYPGCRPAQSLRAGGPKQPRPPRQADHRHPAGEATLLYPAARLRGEELQGSGRGDGHQRESGQGEHLSCAPGRQNKI